MNKEIPYKIYLSENELPTSWYNLRAFMKNKLFMVLLVGILLVAFLLMVLYEIYWLRYFRSKNKDIDDIFLVESHLLI